jgi:hypothetical protein
MALHRFSSSSSSTLKPHREGHPHHPHAPYVVGDEVAGEVRVSRGGSHPRWITAAACSAREPRAIDRSLGEASTEATRPNYLMINQQGTLAMRPGGRACEALDSSRINNLRKGQYQDL